MKRRSRGRAVAVGVVLAAAAAAAALVAAQRDDGGRAPPLLLDGSPARAARSELDLGAAAALVRVRLDRPAARASGLGACLRLAAVDEAPAEVLETVGVYGRSLTFRVAGAAGLVACDGSTRAREPRAGPWCGTAYGRLYAGRLRDGRLDLVNCLDGDGRTVAFGWIEPDERARWVAVRDGGVEVYPVVRGYPLRVTTHEIDTAAASAAFDVAEYASDGRRIAARRVLMRVAG